MTAYDDAIGRARRLWVPPNKNREYLAALVDMCAAFDPDRELEEARQRAEALIEYRPGRRVSFDIEVPNIDFSDPEVAETILAALNHFADTIDAGLPFHVTSDIEVDS